MTSVDTLEQMCYISFIMKNTTDWLLTGPPWVQYRTRLDLLGQSEKDKEVADARQAMQNHPQIKAMITELREWPGKPLLRHNDASHLLHKLVFIADLGVKADDPGVSQIIEKVMERRSKEGVFQVMANITPRFGGSGKDELCWMLCDTPSILYALVKMGMGKDPAVQTAAQHIAGLGFEDGWPCTVSPEMGKFHGPGRRTDPCPYATVITLKALAQLPEWRASPACKNGIEAILKLWEQRKERKPYLFGMGTDFKKLKLPFIWYDVLHVLETLTQFPGVSKDKRVLEMADIVKGKADGEGKFTAESAWKAWADWDFGQKKTPSYWITLQAQRILGRL
jgi:hypothetical protein